VLAVVLGLGTTLAAFQGVRSANHDRLVARFERETGNLAMGARQRIDSHLDVFYSLRDHFDAEGAVTRQAFAAFTRSQLQRHPGIQALEWVPVVPRSARAAFEAAARREGLAGFRLTERDAANRLVPAGDRPVYYPVFYVEPLVGNEPALGYAPALPARDAAIAQARDTGRAAATAAFAIVQGVRGEAGVAIFVPVYAGGRVPAAVPARRAALRGLVEGVVVPDDVLKLTVDEGRAAGIAVSLTDEAATGGQRRLIAGADPADAPPEALRRDMVIDVAGRPWRLSFQLVGDDVLAGAPAGLEWVVLLFGLVATGLLGGYLSNVLGQRARVEQLVVERTEALRHEKELAQKYLDVAAVMIVMVDPEGRVTLINRPGSEMLGWAQDDILGRDWHETFVPAAWRDAARERAREVLLDGAVPHFFEGCVVTRGGDERLIAWHSTALRDEAGRAIAMLSSGADVTDYKRAIEEVAARRAELQQAKEIDRLKNNFASAVSHDLRTPLTSIMGYAEFLEDGIGGTLSDQQRAYVLQIVRGARRLEHLVDDLLDFARLDAGTFQLRREPADLGREIQEVSESLRPQVEEAGLTLEVACRTQPLEAPMDAARVERVLVNLLHNAIKFTPRGGTIRVNAWIDGGCVHCEVADSGIGIPADQIPKLFVRFSQLKSGSEKGGTGLGLSICRAIVEAHDGTIGVRSEPGRGSTFWFSIPAA
jgi:PAS domain S-box-containing protein